MNVRKNGRNEHYNVPKILLCHCSAILIFIGIFIYLQFYVAFNTVQVISQRVVGRAEETST